MRKLFTILVLIPLGILLTTIVFAQTPEKMSYQAVIRNSSSDLVTNTQVGMQISILQGSATGAVVYIETQTPTTNANGLVSIEIGGGAGFSTINWANDVFFIKTETDPTGGTNYTITGTSQLLSVPYALHAKTAETYTGTITETDPVYTSSEAANITASDIIHLGNLSGTNTGDQELSTFATITALGDSTAQLRSEIPDVSGFLSTETDPIFTVSQAVNITASDITNLGNLSGTNTGDQELSGYASVDSLAAHRIDINTNLGKDTTGIFHLNRSALDLVSGTNTGDQIEVDPIYASDSARIVWFKDLSGIRDTLQFYGDSLLVAFDSLAVNRSMIQTNRANILKNADSLAVYRTAINANGSAITTLQTEQSAQDNAIALNTAKTGITPGTTAGEMRYWDGTSWVTLAPTENQGATLQMIGGIPTWVGGTPPATVPDAPAIGTAAAGDALATVTFTAPANDGGSAITGYNATSSPGNLIGTIAQSGSGTITVTGLTNGIAYTFTVSATNAIGTSSSSTASNTVTPTNIPPAIGSDYQGGKVAYILQVGDPGYDAGVFHGLIAAPSDQASDAPWIEGGATQSTYCGNTFYAIGTGQANTNFMIAQTGFTGGAAKICDDLVLNGYDDWYLPSEGELAQLFYHWNAIGGFSTYTHYWSSFEVNSISAYTIYFTFTGLQTIPKGQLCHVRAIRAF